MKDEGSSERERDGMGPGDANFGEELEGSSVSRIVSCFERSVRGASPKFARIRRRLVSMSMDIPPAERNQEELETFPRPGGDDRGCRPEANASPVHGQQEGRTTHEISLLNDSCGRCLVLPSPVRERLESAVA